MRDCNLGNNRALKDSMCAAQRPRVGSRGGKPERRCRCRRPISPPERLLSRARVLAALCGGAWLPRPG